jgi:hypothetical protein
MVRKFLILTMLTLAVLVRAAAPEPGSGLHQYLVFSGPVQEGSRFEPSGAAWDRLSNRYIIFNDKTERFLERQSFFHHFHTRRKGFQ